MHKSYPLSIQAILSQNIEGVFFLSNYLLSFKRHQFFQKMKNTFLMLFWAAISLNTVSGQKVNVQIKAGYLASQIDYSWETPVTQTGSNKGRPTFALSVDGQIYKGFYLGAELGTCSYLHSIDFSYTRTDPSFTATDKYLGWYKQEQVYLTLNPQYRFGPSKLFVVGCGMGVYNNYVNAFSNGYRSTTITKPQVSNSTENLDGKDYLSPNTTVGGFINAVVNPKLDKIGLVFEVRYVFNDYTRGQTTSVKPDVRFNSLALLAGLSFHL